MYFSKIIIHIFKYTDFKKKIKEVKIKNVFRIFINNSIASFIISFLVIIFIKYSFRYINLNKYHLLLLIISIYIIAVFDYTHVYLNTYKIFPVTKISAIIFIWGVIIFHNIFEEGIVIYLTFIIVNLFLYLYNHLDDKKNHLEKEINKTLFFLMRKIPIMLFILFIAAFIEALELGDCFK